jgi:hypothetical protein
MVKRLAFGVEAFDDIAKTIAPSQLSEDHTNQLLAHSEVPNARVGIEMCGQPCQSFAIDQIQNLRKNKASKMHHCEQAVGIPQNSNVRHAKKIFSC